MASIEKKCTRYMESQLTLYPELYTEFISGTINATLLSEDCADHFGLYEDCSTPFVPADFIFDLAVDIALAYERKHS